MWRGQQMAITKINDCVVSPNSAYMFDTNVWLYIFGPVAGAGTYRQRVYSRLLSDIISRKAGLFITSLVVSEYINRVLRIGFDNWKVATRNPLADFKRDYRSTDDYADALADAKLQIREILNLCNRYPDGFNAVDIDSVLNMMGQSADYNDSYLVLCCKNRNIKLVSSDKDLQKISSGIELICD